MRDDSEAYDNTSDTAKHRGMTNKISDVITNPRTSSLQRISSEQHRGSILRRSFIRTDPKKSCSRADNAEERADCDVV